MCTNNSIAYKSFRKPDFRGGNFRRLLAFAVPKDTTPPNFVEKTFTNSHKAAKFANRKFPTI